MNKKRGIKKEIVMIIMGIVLAILLLSSVVFYKIHSQSKTSHTNYEIVKVKKREPLLLNGRVQPRETYNFILDASLGKLSNISVQDGQKVNKNDVIATYEDTSIEEQADEQSMSLDKLNVAVTNAQDSYNNEIQKQRELENRLQDLKNKESAILNKQMENEVKDTKKAEYESKIEDLQQILDTQKDAVLQAKQTLYSANVDLTSANDAIEKTRKKVTNYVTAPFNGTIYLNEDGKINNSIPYATIVSPENIVKGHVSEYDYDKIFLSQKVTIKSLNSQRNIEGTISDIKALPDSDIPNQTDSNTEKSVVSSFSFFADPKEPIKNGFNVQISIPFNTLEIPKSAVLRDQKETFVFLFKKGKCYKTKVQVKKHENAYIVEKGLKENDEIILRPNAKMKDGQEVTVNK